ncbi:hypothetical protein MF406_07780 [Georgenia sp. TF02-10]|uniref:hypothetical protein n=1 Tax=Georgenia sp. TF02-10 TaxID=2917725 RepID=UPI001FA6BCA6|nr:hypothetical protein [Georgenia sp. TF02-10]UNX56096.1 hypothetical protein MF406_07780 [Georgenia sp. TF02-10]
MGTALATAGMVDRQARLAAARSALTRAETAAGLRTRLPAAGSAGATALVAVPGPAVDPAGPGPTAAPPAAAQVPVPTAGPGTTAVPPSPATVPAAPAAPAPGDDLPVPAALAPLFPGGVLARGTVVQVAGSTSLLLTLAAGAAAVGAWSALTALPDVGWRAAAEAGLDLDRVLVVPRPGPDAPAVLGALADGVDLLVVGRCPALSDRDRRSLSARLRARQGVLLSAGPWPGANLALTVERTGWEGLGRGWGTLARQRMVITAVGRGAAAGPVRTVEVSLGAGTVRATGPARPADVGGPAEQAPVLRAVG